MRAFLILVLISSLALGITRSQILDVSRKDIDKAIEMFKEYILEHPGENLEKLGRFIYTKKLLSDDPYIGDAIVREDATALVVGLLEKDQLSRDLVEKISIVMNLEEIVRERLLSFDENAIKLCNKLDGILKVDAEEFGRRLVERYFKNPLGFDPSSYVNLKCLDKSSLKEGLKEAMEEEFEKGQETYLKLWYLRKILKVDFEGATVVTDYADLYTQLMDASNARDLIRVSKIIDLMKERGFSPPIFEMPSTPVSPTAREGKSKESNRTALTFAVLTIVTAAIAWTVMINLEPRHKIRRLKKKIQRDPFNPKLHIKLAQIYEKLGRTEDAMEEYRIATKLTNEKNERT